jgi:single-strand DNA-binding protein
MELEVDEVGPSLRYATAKVQKMARSGGSSGGGFGSGGGNNTGGGFDDPWASAVPTGGGSGNGSAGSFDEEPPF